MLQEIIGVYEDDRGCPQASILMFDATMSADDALATVKRAARDYLKSIANEDDGFEMPYPYDFGDVVEMADVDPDFVTFLASRGIRNVGTTPFAATVIDHDDIWVPQDLRSPA